MFNVYVLINPDQQIYIGQTDNLEKRLSQHNAVDFNKGSYTKLHHGPWRVAYKERYSTRRGALERERQLKSHKGRDWLRGMISLDS